MTDGLRSIRPLGPESLRGVEPAAVGNRLPKFEWVNPRTLYVEEAYQRGIGEAGTGLIRKIYGGFDWSRYKTPICVRLPDSGNVLVCIDGQHTATACASHPGIDKIPVMVVPADQVDLRAAAFVGHNRDRVALTAQAIYHAELAAGDEVACAVDRACHAAGANIPRKAFSSADKVPIGTTMSIGTIKAIARRQGEEFLTRVLRLLVGAGRPLIKSDEIAAAAIVMKFVDPDVDDRLRAIVAGQTADEWAVDGRSRGIESGESVAAEIAKAWLRGLHVKADVPTVKNTYGAARKIIATIAPNKPGFKAKPKPVLQQKPPAVLQPKLKAEPIRQPAAGQATRPAPPAPKADDAHTVRRNGVEFDLQTYELKHRGKSVRVPRDDSAALVAALVRVMPSMLDFSRLAKMIGATGVDATAQVRNVVEDVNPVLRRARLEIKTIPKMGHTLYDLGPE